MSTEDAVPHTADGVRARNAELDAELRSVIAGVTSENLHESPGADEWSPAELLGHLSEFPRFFAADLRRFYASGAETLGRTVEHPDRNAAVAAAKGRSADDLRAACDDALADLAFALEDLRDEHVRAPTRNVKYGEEPLTAFLDRYLLGHKAAHARQLRAAIDQVA